MKKAAINCQKTTCRKRLTLDPKAMTATFKRPSVKIGTTRYQEPAKVQPMTQDGDWYTYDAPCCGHATTVRPFADW